MQDDVRYVQGVAVHARGEGPGIVLLHANGGDHRDFEAVIPELARTRRVYAIDWPGHGLSEPAAAPTALQFAALLPAILDELCDGPVALIGNSVGGFAALRTAIAHPELVSRLILVNPGGFTPGNVLTRAACRGIASRPMAPLAMRALPWAYLRRRNPGVRAARQRAALASGSRDRVAVFASMWRSFADAGHDARRDVDQLRVPTLLVWGVRDPVLPWLVDGRRAERALAGAQVVRLPCGHQAFLELPQQFLAVALPFLDASDAGAP